MTIKESIKTARDYRRDPIGFISSLSAIQGERSILNVFGMKLIILVNPKDVLHVLKDNSSSYCKGRTTQKLQAFLGNGLITNDGDSWRKQHRLIRPMMNIKSVYGYGPRMLETTTLFIGSIDCEKEINSFHEMNRLTWRIVLGTLFSQNATVEMDKWLDDILFILSSITLHTRSVLPIPFWIPTKHNIRLKKAIGQFDKFVFEIIEQRRTGVKKNDLLQLLIDAREEGHGMDDLQIRDEIMTFLMAGHETITNTMTWALMALANNPNYKNDLRAEAAAFFQDQSFDTLFAAPWHSAFIDEVMRLWPPVWVFMRQANQEDQIDTLNIPKNANVIVSPYLTQRSEKYWSNPEKFYPERFLPEEKKKLIAGSYFPYGLGPRACIGSFFASLEAKIILATFVHHFDWDIMNPKEQTHEAGITLRPTNNIMMNFRRIK